MQKTAPIWLAKAVALCLLGSTGEAATIANTFGPGDTFSAVSYVIGSAVLQQEIGAPFISSVTARLDSIRVATSFASGLNDFTIYLAPDIGGQPGLPLESFTGVSFGGIPSIITLSSRSHPLLIGSSLYVLVVSAPDLVNSQGGWHINDQGVNGVLARNFFGNFNWIFDPSSTPAFDVSGTVVPEPSTFVATLWVFLIAVARQRYLKRKQSRPAMLGTCKLTV